MKKMLLLFTFISFLLSTATFAQNTYVLNLQDENHYFQIDDNTNNDLDLGSNFTVEAWIYINDATHGNERIFYTSNWQMYVVSGTGSGGADATIRINGSDIGQIDMSVPTEEWHHVCLNSNGTWANNYIDGSAVQNAGATTLGDINYLRIGSYSLTSTDFQGAIDEVRISNVTRYGQWSFSVSKNDPPFTDDANTILLYHFDNNTEFPPGNSSSKVFTVTNYGIDASDYFAWNDASFSEDLPLPVELTSFTAKAGDSQVMLNWQTASESNNMGFEVLRSQEKETAYELIDSYQNNSALQGGGNSSEARNYSFVDRSVFNGTLYWYKLVDVDMNGIRTEHGPIYAMPHAKNTDLDPLQGDLPKGFALRQNYPNPFNPSTTISFDIPDMKSGLLDVDLSIYNINGKKIKSLVHGAVTPGIFRVEWNATDDNNRKVPSGIYFYHLRSAEFSATCKMILAK